MGSVLIVDDEPRVRELLARWLGSAGHDVREAEDAETALALMAAGASDVVMCDIQMPGQGGLWLVERLREQFPQSAVVLATADEAVPPFVSLRGGVVDYLVKPYGRERVLAAVRGGIEWHAAAVARGAERTPAEDPLAKWIKPE